MFQRPARQIPAHAEGRLSSLTLCVTLGGDEQRRNHKDYQGAASEPERKKGMRLKKIDFFGDSRTFRQATFLHAIAATGYLAT